MSDQILITQEMLNADPTLVERGYLVGDILPEAPAHILPSEPQQPQAEQQAPAQPEVKTQPASGYQVFDRDGTYVRSYTREIHQGEAESKAHQFANKIGGTVKVVDIE